MTLLAAWRIGLKLQKEAAWVILYFFLPIVWLGILGFDRSRWNSAVQPAPWAGNGFLRDNTTWSGIPVQAGAYPGSAPAAQGYGAPGAYPPPRPGTPPPAGYAAAPVGIPAAACLYAAARRTTASRRPGTARRLPRLRATPRRPSAASAPEPPSAPQPPSAPEPPAAPPGADRAGAARTRRAAGLPGASRRAPASGHARARTAGSA